MFYNALFPSRSIQNSPGYQQHIREENEAYILELTLPGIKRDALELSIESQDDSDFLTIQVSQEASQHHWYAKGFERRLPPGTWP